MAYTVFALTALLLVTAQVGADERSFYFGGTLAGETRCPPSEGSFCGAYAGTLTIDDDQVSMEWIPGHDYIYRYTEARVVFADGQTVTSYSPSTLPRQQSAIMSVTPKFVVEKDAQGRLTIIIDILDSESGFGTIAPRYIYGAGTFDPAVLCDVLAALPGKPSSAKLFVVGGACSWGPCVDHSLTPLTPEAKVRNED